jgi:hypothetical protein
VAYLNKSLTINGKPVPTEVLPDFFDESTMRYHKHRRETLGVKPHQTLQDDDRPAFVPGADQFKGRENCNYTVEGVTKNRTMVKLAGVDRHVRPWEILVADETETNPHRRVITSPDVETALEKGRKARSEGRVSKRMMRKEPVLKDAKKNKAVNQSMVGKWLETEDGFQGTVVRATKTGLWLEVVANGKRSDMLVREGEPYTVLTSPPKATNDDDDDDDEPPVSTARTAMVGQIYELNSKRFSVVKVKVDTKKICIHTPRRRKWQRVQHHRRR